MQRLQVLSGHLRPPGQSPGLSADFPGLRSSVCGAATSDSPDDVVIVHGLRTAIGKAKRGSFKDTTPDELLSAVMKAVLSDVHLSPDRLGDVCVGNVLQPGAGALMARVAHFLSRCVCAAGAVRSGTVDLGLACGITSENVAQEFGISREKQDEFALRSHQRAARAQSRGLFKEEIVPVQTQVLDGSGSETRVLVSEDEGIRPSTTMEGLSRLRPAFSPEGSTTAGLTVDDIDVFEINEAFASQAVFCVEKLGIPQHKVNPNGGAIALGHPLGCTGARQVVTLLHELLRKRRGDSAHNDTHDFKMCLSAAVFEYPGP
uniref:acetyl-CoA C-acetyltransferase n=1 Tax=Periophthalmus magnuspinnatus TaxID=409849 RepID=A0A3B4AEC0_9GOBI